MISNFFAKIRWIFWIVCCFLGTDTVLAADPTPTLDLQSHCDAPGPVLKTEKVKEAEACRQLCREQTDCIGFYHVSGWGRCFLKSKASKTTPLRIYSGVISLAKDGARSVIDATYDKDYSGKDLRRVTSVTSGEACGQECIKEPLCQAFAYFEGLRDCWLKKAAGHPYGKIFSCGLKKG